MCIFDISHDICVIYIHAIAHFVGGIGVDNVYSPCCMLMKTGKIPASHANHAFFAASGVTG